MSNITETLKARLDELDLDRRLNDVVGQAEQTLQSALSQVGGLVQERRGDIDRFLDSTSSTLNERTEGKYAAQVGKVRGHLDAGLAKLAEQHAPAQPSSEKTGADQPGSWGGATDSPTSTD